MLRQTTILAAGGVCLAATAFSASAQEYSVVHGSPNGHVLAEHGVEYWLSCMEEASVEGLSFRYFPAGQLATSPELLDALKSQVADLGIVSIGYESDTMPLNGVSMLPGLGRTAEDVITAYSAAVEEGPLAEEFATNGIVPIWVMGFPPYQVVSVDGVIRTPEDFQGKVFRSAGGAMSLLLSSLGASPAEIPVGDMYIALERGTVDGTISALTSLKPFNVHELMESASTNGAFGTFTNVFSIRSDLWENLPEATRTAMMECGAEVESHIATFMDEESAALATEFADMGATIYEFTEDELATLDAQAAEVEQNWVGRLSGRGLPAEEVAASYSARFETE